MSDLGKPLLFAFVAACLPTCGFAAPVTNKSFEGKYKTTAHFCSDGQCDDQAETVTSAFFVGEKNVHVYAGANK